MVYLQLYFPLKEYNKKKKYKSPIRDKFVSYHLEQYDVKKVRKKKIVRGLLPSFIHSIDASLMRLIIIDIYDNTNHIINHLHDFCHQDEQP